MILYPNAKINIGLNITKKRADGFHNIETIFYPIGLSDILEINISNDKIKFENTGLSVENKKFKSNICYKAYKELNNDFSLKPLNIHLHKIIPFGAGLGGGSSDASFTLKAINSIMKLNIDDNSLLKHAEEIGSDCPFFIINKPTFAEEKGNIFKPIDLKLKGYFLVIIYSDIHINTAEAYERTIPKKPKTSLLELIKQPIEHWKGTIKNDFEDSVFKDYPELKDIKDQLYNLGAIYASMSGSGSAIFGLFENKIDIPNNFEKDFKWTEML
ncbi:MAG: 4-(cytidine 5'-diphospho)-2-C-methyl-D-erythritol kinase [Bacteroidales bacterium]|jgi:4-diphosphocytidyl-2-C-methyl-D-erythritol kinase|nr:4-(cytidine 5'-diphospho)-2-C-methyl-D-erythritol kinase [Bacteroidales bacterium]